MNEQLLLSYIRNVLIRLEETIIFALIERAQFQTNETIYKRGVFGEATGGTSLVGFLLHEIEKSHAKVRRYTSPDEEPFFQDLPGPVLPPLTFDENPLWPNTISASGRVRSSYENEIVPFICSAGDDSQYGSSAVCDVACLQALSKRVHYGKFVAESKYQTDPGKFRPMIRARDSEGIMQGITDPVVETRVLARVGLKAQTYGQDVDGDTTQFKIDPERVVEVYSRWIIPLTKDVQVAYLLQRGTPEE